MKLHVIVDTHGHIIATGPVAPDGPGPKAQLVAGPSQTRHELELPQEFDGKSPADLHKLLAKRELKPFIVATVKGTVRG
jgi:hypothetical protein